MPSSDHKARNYVKSATGIWGPVGFGASDQSVPVSLSRVTVSSFGQISTSADPTIAFGDQFDGVVFDTINKWNTYGTVAATQTQGSVSINPSTTANATVAVAGQAALNVATTLVIAAQVTFESGTTALGNHRFFGSGTAPSNVGTAAAPLTDAVGFEIDTSGILRASVYNTGTRVFTQALTMPTDGVPHLVLLILRGDVAFFHLDDTNIPVAFTQIGPANQAMPLRMHSLNSASVTGTPTMVCKGLLVADMSRQATFVADATYPWRRARVDPTGALSVAPRAADLAVTAVGSTGNAVTLTLPAAGAGQFHYICSLHIVKYATSATTGGATPITVTTTNLAGSVAYTFGTAQAVGTLDVRDHDYGLPLKSSVANTATTIVCPAITNIIWRVTATYYTTL